MASEHLSESLDEGTVFRDPKPYPDESSSRQPCFASIGAGAKSLRILLDGKPIEQYEIAWFRRPFDMHGWGESAPGRVLIRKEGGAVELLEGDLQFLSSEDFFKHWCYLHQGRRRVPMINLGEPCPEPFDEWLEEQNRRLAPPAEE